MESLCGIINVYKESGWTSFDVVNKIRHLLHVKKVGHTGTLDPDAQGVLAICVGKPATRLSEQLSHKDKIYETTLLLGKSTDTLDISGQILSESRDYPDENRLREIIMSFKGESMQTPPMFSAKKVGGKKLYELAREGKEIERKQVRINVYDLEILNIDIPRVMMRIHCSSGTYIRSICDDIGKAAGCGGCMENLLRIDVGGMFKLEDSLKINQIIDMTEKEDFSFIQPIDKYIP